MPKLQQKPFLAFDLGAESGRAVLGSIHAGIINIREVHRFPNEPVEYGSALHWDAPRLWFEMRRSLSSLGEVVLGGIGVDAWGVDYALLGERGELLQNPYHYRDKRTDGLMETVFDKVSKQEIYRKTGIQFMVESITGAEGYYNGCHRFGVVSLPRQERQQRARSHQR